MIITFGTQRINQKKKKKKKKGLRLQGLACVNQISAER